MRLSELLRLVWLNINQNKFKTVMTSIGIIVGAATIVMVIAIGRGGKMDVAEQFASLNAGSIDITYDYEGEETTTSGSGSFSISDLGSSLMSNVSSFFNMGGWRFFQLQRRQEFIGFFGFRECCAEFWRDDDGRRLCFGQ